MPISRSHDASHALERLSTVRSLKHEVIKDLEKEFEIDIAFIGYTGDLTVETNDELAVLFLGIAHCVDIPLIT